MASFSSTAFSETAFSPLAFDFGTGPVAETIVGDSTRHSYDLYLKQEEKRLRAKQEEITKLRLEAQEALLEKRKLAAEKTKQNTRQLRALEAREIEIQKELLLSLAQLRELQKHNKRRQGQEALLVLSLACPFVTMH